MKKKLITGINSYTFLSFQKTLLSGVAIFFHLAILSNAKAAMKPQKDRLPTKDHFIEIKSHPSIEDWQFFMGSDADILEELWHSTGSSLSTWAWGWRLAWVRRCERLATSWCGAVLQAGLFDKSLLVRSRTAQAWGRVYAATQNRQAISLLKRAFKFSENTRKGKPMFIQKRILYALFLIGGTEAHESARALSQSDEQTSSYWMSLSLAAGKVKITPK